MNPKKPLSPLQNAIRIRVERLRRVEESALRRFLAQCVYLDAAATDDQEIAMSIDLLALYGALEIEQHPRRGRVLVYRPHRGESLPAEALDEFFRSPAEFNLSGESQGS